MSHEAKPLILEEARGRESTTKVLTTVSDGQKRAESNDIDSHTPGLPAALALV